MMLLMPRQGLSSALKENCKSVKKLFILLLFMKLTSSIVERKDFLLYFQVSTVLIVITD